MLPQGYQVALICRNGHLVNASGTNHQAQNTAFCSRCGADVLSACLHCHGEIRGRYMSKNSLPGAYVVPSYCPECGRPYPWTETALQTFKTIAAELESLTPDQREKLASSIDDLVADTPRTQLAALRVKAVWSKLSAEATDVLKSILVTVATEGAKKMLGI